MTGGNKYETARVSAKSTLVIYRAYGVSMSTLPAQTLSAVKNQLLHQKKLLVARLKGVGAEITLAGLTEPAERGTHSWHAHVYETERAVKNQLLNIYKKVEYSLTRLRDGTYGVCERCGRQIEIARLKIMPTATLCVGCK